MWLSRLDLLAFGRFTDVRLALGPGFHLVYGPNEAGKSTTLRAIRQLLFGFDERTSDNFVHANPNLRIGGIVQGESGIELEVIRRKARKDSLRSADDVTVIEPDEWQKLLCGIDEATFSRRYGIDYEQLIQGGHEIATGTGDLGEILFATGSGVMDLSTVRKQLNDEAEKLFKPQGKKQRLNQAIVDWHLHREEVAEKLLSASTWEEADRLRQEVKTRLDEITLNWTHHASEVERYRRWQQAWPLVREKDALEQNLIPLASVRLLPDEFGSKRQEAMLLLKQVAAQEQSGLEELHRVQQQLEQLAIPEAVLAKSDDLNNLFTESGSYLKAQLDRPKLVEQYDPIQKVLDELRKMHDASADEPQLAGVHLDRSQRTRVNQLGRQQAALTQAVQQAQTRRERLEQSISDMRHQITRMPVVQPLDDLRTAVKLARFDGDLEARLTKVCDELIAREDEARLQKEQMGLWSGSMSELRSMRVPTLATIKEWETKFETNLAEQTLLRTRLSELEHEHVNLENQIAQLRQEYQVPTEADLETARQNRGEIWGKIREAILSKKFPTKTSITQYEQSLLETDRLADRLRNEAERVAQLADQLADLSTNETRQHEISIRIAELEAKRIELEQGWQAEWLNLRAIPLSPREMQTWIARREILLQNEVQTSQRRTEANEIRERISAHIESLSQRLGKDCQANNAPLSGQASLLQSAPAESSVRSEQAESRQQLSFGWESTSAELVAIESKSEVSESFDELLAAAEERLDRDELIQKTYRDTEETLARLLTEKSEAIEQCQLANDELAQWQTVWKSAMEELKLAPDSLPDVAIARIETLFELMDHQRQAEQLHERIAGIDADAEQFQSHVKTLCQEIAPDLLEQNLNESVVALRARLSKSQRDQVKFNDLTARKHLCEQQLEMAKESRTRGEALVVELCQKAGICSSVSESMGNHSATSLDVIFQEMQRAEEQSRLRADYEEKRDLVENRLRELAKDVPIDEFMDLVGAQSLESLTDCLRDLDQESNRITVERDRLNHQLGGIDEQLRAMDGGAAAADAEEIQRQMLAQIRTDAEQYIRVKLASSVLHSAIERYREKTRGPVLSVASELFRELTLESFGGLRVDEDEQNRPVLVGLRSGGRDAVPVTGMSEGTCDQLYLALRLASLRLESAPRSQLPFIVDDILIQFDDARAAAALRILSQLGQQRQVIFFTHHEHLLEIAQKHLPGQYLAHRLTV